MSATSALRIALIYPELLGTYGDGGNALILQARSDWRGQPAEVVPVPAGQPLPSDCDVYLLGGGEDEPQALAAAGVRSGDLAGAVAGGAVVLAVCAGLQVIGTRFPGTDGHLHDGAGLVDLDTAPGTPRVVGDLVVQPRPETGLPLLYGYENHSGRTTLGEGVCALGGVRRGLGNGAGQRDERGRGYEGVWAPTGRGLVVGSYLHGPVLAQNPHLADLLLEAVCPDLPVADPHDPRLVRADSAAATLRAARARQTRVR
ncbi:MAG TPA: glutamine amidotransferase [Mycobacteriales bacterium]|nr:glutamine amidotransferase [Mycobacteriales bacterium]